MKKLITITVLMALAMSGFAQEVHFDFSVTNSTGYAIYYRIIDEENHWIEATYPCQNGDNYWWGFDQPEGKLILSETVNHNGIDYTLVSIGDHAFCSCTDLRGSLELPQTINSIGDGAYKGCSNLSGNLALPELITHVGEEAFANCSKLAGELHFGDSLAYIGDRAFIQCNFIGQLMFPSNLTFIGEKAFKGNTNIEGISIKAVAPPQTATNAFEDISTMISVAVPYLAQEPYQNAPGWSQFANHIIEKSYWDGKTVPWTKGSGTNEDPYLIESAEHLAWLAKSVNEKLNIDYYYYEDPMFDTIIYYDTTYYDVIAYQDTCFLVVIDIDLQKDQGFLWNPIGYIHYRSQPDYAGNESYTTCFSGHFDGNGHEISNCKMHANNHIFWNQPNYLGLFGNVKEAYIGNLSINQVSINSLNPDYYSGIIVGNAINSTISDCNASGELFIGNVEQNKGGGIAGGIVGSARSCRIENCMSQIEFIGYTKSVGGIVGQYLCNNLNVPNTGIFSCGYMGSMIDLAGDVGGIVGTCKSASENNGNLSIENCFSRGSMIRFTLGQNWVETYNHSIGGIVGYVKSIDTLSVLNCYSNNTIIANTSNTHELDAFGGGIIAKADSSTTLYIKNCYHVNPISSRNKGGIVAQNTNHTLIRNCYFDQTVAPDDGFGVPLNNEYMKTAAFVNQLNNGSTVFMMDHEPYVNDGYPIFGTDGLIFVGAEWYYEIMHDDGSITYQHLQCTGDTIMANKRPKVIVRSNTHYYRGENTEVTHEYVYEENGIVYWWNEELQDFTILYDFSAEVGDEWVIRVGSENIVSKVYEVETQMIEGIPYKRMTIGDSNNIFSGTIISTIGHTTSFFPERLMNRGKGYRVEGMRCYWVDGELVFKYGDRDCDEVYQKLHNGIDEPGENGPSTGSGTFMVYPNPANGILFVETRHGTSLPAENQYRITNLMGQTLLQGTIIDGIQQINIESLPAGMYFITCAGETLKFVVK